MGLRRFALIAACLASDGCAGAGDGQRDATDRGQASARTVASAVHPWCSGGPVSSPLLLTSDSLGPVTPTVTRRELSRVCPTTRDTTVSDAEGNDVEATILQFGGREVGLAEWSREQRLERIRVLSPHVETPRRLRVGSTVRDIRQRLGPLKAGYDDAGVYVWSDAERRLSYLLRVDTARLPPSPDDVAKRPEAIPDSAVVRALLFDPSG
jgi:hypothetical protein